MEFPHVFYHSKRRGPMWE